MAEYTNKGASLRSLNGEELGDPRFLSRLNGQPACSPSSRKIQGTIALDPERAVVSSAIRHLKIKSSSHVSRAYFFGGTLDVDMSRCSIQRPPTLR
jgi:hypothetical protein